MPDIRDIIPEARQNVPLNRWCTLRAGGPAKWLAEARTSKQLADWSVALQKESIPILVLGGGSNVLPSDQGVSGVVLVNSAAEILVKSNGEVLADTGCLVQDLCIKTAQARCSGLQFGIGIPGSLGGALVSNAGAYRSEISHWLEEIEIVRNGSLSWSTPDVLELSYRDSILRRPNPPQMVMTRCRLQLDIRPGKTTYDQARDHQRQRISKQPTPASAGSFFKNVYSQELADSLDNLPSRLKDNGVVPAGYLIQAAGLMGARVGGAQLSPRHANFMTNVKGASATDIRALATKAKTAVSEKFGVILEEEVLYIGDWPS
jgi:UDP-N-acetylmuramate dehydrogenase